MVLILSLGGELQHLNCKGSVEYWLGIVLSQTLAFVLTSFESLGRLLNVFGLDFLICEMGRLGHFGDFVRAIGGLLCILWLFKNQ